MECPEGCGATLCISCDCEVCPMHDCKGSVEATATKIETPPELF